MLSSIRGTLSSVEGLFALVGLSIVGAIAALHRIYVFTSRRFFRWRDQRDLGELEYRKLRRLAKRSGPEYEMGSLRGHVENLKSDLSSAAVLALREEVRDRLARLASGTLGLSFMDLLGDESLLIDTSFVDEEGSELLFDQLRPEYVITESSRPGTILIGSAGAGKSTACRRIEGRWLNSMNQAWLITVEPLDFVVETQFEVGSRDWFLALVERRLFDSGLLPIERAALDEIVDSHLQIIVDAVDEAADQLSAAESERFLNSWTLQHALLVTSRTSFYETSLLGRRSLARLSVVSVEDPDDEAIDAFIESIARRLRQGNEQSRLPADAVGIRRSHPSLRALTRNPLLATMFVSLTNFDLVSTLDVTDIYREFVRQSIARDRQEDRVVNQVETVTEALCELATRRFGNQSVDVSRASIVDAIAQLPEVPIGQRQSLVTDIEACSLVSLRRDRLSISGDYQLSFRHKSFEDYLVARRVEDWLCSRVHDRGSDFFFHVDTPEVTYFLKDAMRHLARDPSRRSLASRRLRELLDRLLRDRREATDELAARSFGFAAGQAAYYLGMLGEEETQNWLEAHSESETDFWVRRSAVIGLAFGGRAEAFHRFIDEMRLQVERGDLSMARRNIAVELAFYGDHAFDPLDPTYDHAGASCSRLVNRSVEELGLDIEDANWRMILFNLNFLARHRSVSTKSFTEEVNSHRGTLEPLLRAMASDPARSRHPEPAELLEVISS